MTAEERLALVRAKIERAEKHIGDLESEIKSFYESKPYVVGTKRDQQSRRLIYHLVSVRDTPVGVAALTGDVLNNLRSALDHLAYQLVLVGTGDVAPTWRVYFPIADDAAKYASHSLAQIKGMRQDAVNAIAAIRPYKGGNDTLWRLHKLNNIDKHRYLVIVGLPFVASMWAR
jgi:hypothetical protein